MILSVFFLFLFILTCTLFFILFYAVIPQLTGTKQEFFSQDDTDYMRIPASHTPYNRDKKRALVFCSSTKKILHADLFIQGTRTAAYLKHFTKPNMIVLMVVLVLVPVCHIVLRMQ